MSNYSPSRSGQINQTGDTAAIFLKKFAGEVLLQFEIANKMMARTFIRNVESGKSVQWPRLGRAAGRAYHTAGAELTGNSVDHSEIVATIDDLLVSDVFIDKLDDAMNHYDVRSKYANLIGLELANTMDEHIIIEALKGARLTAVGNELPTGTAVNGATTGALAFRENSEFLQTAEVTGGAANAASVEAKVDAIRSACYAAAARLDEAEVPEAGRYICVRPREARQLAEAVQSSGFSLMNTDYGTNGSEVAGKVLNFAGFDVVKTTQLPKTDVGSATVYANHGGDYSKTVALIGCQDAVGTGKLLDLNMESEYSVRHQGTLLVASYAVAQKYLRPECLIELVIDTGTVV